MINNDHQGGEDPEGLLPSLMTSKNEQNSLLAQNVVGVLLKVS